MDVAAAPPYASAAASLRRARWATAVVFLVHGSVTGTFAARIPWIKTHVGVGRGELGIALVMPAIGALLSMPFAGRLAHRYALPTLTAFTIAAWTGSLALVGLPDSLPLLCVVLLLCGATAGLGDMAMNAHGVLVEKKLGRSVMSSFHGFWSAGVLVGSAASALCARAGVDPRLQFALTAVVLGCVGIAASRFFLREDAPEEDVDPPPAFALPTRPVLLIGLVGLCSVFGEFASIDWSALYITKELGGSAAIAALAVSAFAITMATTRLVGDRVIRRLGPVKTVRLASGCAFCGALLVVVAQDLALGLAGFALLGIGTAVVIPLVFAAAGRVGPHTGRSIAGAATIAYAGGLAVPGLIGGISAAASLTAAFCVVAVMVGAMGFLAGALRN
jgi:MFS family permease